MAKYQVISTDSHVDVPFGELAQRAPKEFREKIALVNLSEESPDPEQARKAQRRAERMMAKMNEEDLERTRHGGWDPELRVEGPGARRSVGRGDLRPAVLRQLPRSADRPRHLEGVQRLVGRGVQPIGTRRPVRGVGGARGGRHPGRGRRSATRRRARVPLREPPGPTAGSPVQPARLRPALGGAPRHRAGGQLPRRHGSRPPGRAGSGRAHHQLRAVRAGRRPPRRVVPVRQRRARAVPAPAVRGGRVGRGVAGVGAREPRPDLPEAPHVPAGHRPARAAAQRILQAPGARVLHGRRGRGAQPILHRLAHDHVRHGLPASRRHVPAHAGCHRTDLRRRARRRDADDGRRATRRRSTASN